MTSSRARRFEGISAGRVQRYWLHAAAAFGFLAALGFAGGAAAQTPRAVPEAEIEEPTVATPPVFRIGVPGGVEIDARIRAHDCLAQHFEAVLERPVEVVASADYTDLLRQLLNGRLDYAELGAAAYARLWLASPTAAEPILTTEQLDGSSGYHAVMIARRGSGIRALEDMEGRALGVTTKSSLSGYLAPMARFAALGLNPSSYFAATTFTGGHRQNLTALIEGRIDAAITWSSGVGDVNRGYSRSALRSLAEQIDVELSEFVEIWRSPRLPNGPIVVRGDLSPLLKAGVVGALVQLNVTNPDCLRNVLGDEFKRFEPISHNAYGPIIDALKFQEQRAGD